MTRCPPSTEDGLEVTMASRAIRFSFGLGDRLSTFGFCGRTRGAGSSGRNDPGGDADGDGPWWNAFADDGAGADDGVGPDRYAVKDLGARAGPGALANDDA